MDFENSKIFKIWLTLMYIVIQTMVGKHKLGKLLRK